MTELLRAMLAAWLAPAPVDTDLSAARTPSWAVAKRSEKQLSADVAGGLRRQGSWALNLRHAAATEADRQAAYQKLAAVAERLRREPLPQPGNGRVVTALSVGEAAFHEAYDDGTAAWSLELGLEWEEREG